MNRRNYRRELDKIIEKSGGEKKTVLLHSCCGPCSSSVLEYLCRYFDVAVLWYNPNLFPAGEFQKRLDTQKELIEKLGLQDSVRLLETPWRSEEYFAAVKGLESEPEGGARCTECFRLRLYECARIAAEQGFEYFCTTLTVSRHKDAVRINALGEEAAARFGVKWLPSDFKKRGGEMRSQELAEQFQLYRQLYCGCAFSLNKRSDKGDVQ